VARLHDIVILGATPAGLAAAHRLAEAGRDVAVVDAPAQSVDSPLARWVPGTFFRQAHLPKRLIKASGARPFQRVCYHDPTLERSAEHSARSRAGYVLAGGRLTSALRAAAKQVGVRLRSSKTAPAIRLDEERAAVLGTRPVEGRVLLLAQDEPGRALNDLSLSTRTVPRPPLRVAGLDIPLARAADAAPLAGALHLVGMRERSELGLCFAVAATVHLRVISTSPAAGTLADELSALLTALQQAELLPARLPLGRARGAVWTPPAGVALELDSHVAKRCLLIGTAGGFADSITGQVAAPSVRSALLADEIAREGLNAPNTQEVLGRFKTAWRDKLAEALRPPSTSLQMLLPLLFVNRRMVGKFTRALLEGHPI